MLLNIINIFENSNYVLKPISCGFVKILLHANHFKPALEKSLRFLPVKCVPPVATAAKTRSAPHVAEAAHGISHGQVHHRGNRLHDYQLLVVPGIPVAFEEHFLEFVRVKVGGEAGRQHSDVVCDVFLGWVIPVLSCPVDGQQWPDCVWKSTVQLLLFKNSSEFVYLVVYFLFI